MGMKNVSQEKPSLVLWEVKAEEGESVFRLAKFCYYLYNKSSNNMRVWLPVWSMPKDWQFQRKYILYIMEQGSLLCIRINISQFNHLIKIIFNVGSPPSSLFETFQEALTTFGITSHSGLLMPSKVVWSCLKPCFTMQNGCSHNTLSKS